MSTTISQLQETNSTTYTDIVGLQVGLPRLLGESASDYLQRISYAANVSRTHPYEGALNEINLQLGLEPSVYISLTSTHPSAIVTSSIAGITVSTSIFPATFRYLTFGVDGVWEYNKLSQVVSFINNLPDHWYTATLNVPDGPAFQLARQTNSLWAFAEPVAGTQAQLQHGGVVVGSEVFNFAVPSYTLLTSGGITFSAPPPANLTITYNYIVTPYDIVGAPVVMIGMLDPEFPTVASQGNSVLAYQVQEFVQAIMLQDRSYWAR